MTLTVVLNSKNPVLIVMYIIGKYFWYIWMIDFVKYVYYIHDFFFSRIAVKSDYPLLFSFFMPSFIYFG